MIAIHHRKNSFSEQWINYCNENDVPYKLVDCYDSNIISELSDCKALMWHWSFSDSKAILFVRQLIVSLETKGIKVFPNYDTCWHYDDKVGQKYLLEAIGAPLVPSYVFYTKEDALRWISKTSFPKVFKLRGGAGSANVKLIENKKRAKKLISKAFSKGFHPINIKSGFKERILKFKREKNKKNFTHILKGFIRVFYPRKKRSLYRNEVNYVYFQDYIPENNHDLRVVVIDNKAFGFKRLVRENDFRASGSGRQIYDPKMIPNSVLKVAFNVSNKLKTQVLSFDFIFDKNNNPLIVEISYGFTANGGLRKCPGYWDPELKWNEAKFIHEWFMMECFLKELNRQ